ncbi:MAG: pilus assembly protein [Proteobacteria bacterium]|nr:pilus assembly protein [Pseudomonadota bacterium]
MTALLLAMPLGVGAAGLGKITVLSALGQTLRAEVDISASREELSSLTARVASAEAFKQAGIEYSSALTTIRLSIDKRADGRPFLSMVSDRPLNDPFLDMLVELNWNSGRLVREYTFLLDPPESQQKPSSPIAAPVSPPIATPAAAPIAVPAPVVTPEPRREIPPAQAPPAQAPAAQAPAATQVETREAPQPQPVQPRPDVKPPRGAEDGQRVLKTEPARVEKQSAQRLVKRGDTLSQIATETKPEGVNLDQMLVALFRGNQDAFEGNVNRLKAGKILAIPDSETAASVNADEAKKTVVAHSADFNAYSKKLAASVANAASQKDEAPKRAVSGKIAPKVEDKLPPATPGKDKLEVSKSELAAGAAGKAGAGRLAAIEETLIAREKALKDANSRIAELEKNLNDLKKLIELKNQGMAEMQKQAQVAKPPAPPPPAAEVKKPVAVAEKAVEKPVAKPAEKPVDKPVEAEKKPAPPSPPKLAATAPAPVAQPPAEPSFIDESPEIVYGGGGILALLLFYLGYKRYQQRRGSKPGRADTSEPSSASSEGGMGAPTVDSDNLLSPHDFSNLSGVAGSDGDAGVDPVAEANVYLAYGRDVQAEEILLDALKTDPTRHAIHLKLLEIYANRKSVKQFETIAGDLHNQTGGAGADWDQAAGMGRQVDPSNPLYGAILAPTQATTKEFDPDATLVIKPEEQEIDLGSLELTGGLEEELLPSTPAPEAPTDESPETLPPPEELPVSLDFELDLAEPEAGSPVPALEQTTVSAAPEAATEVDIDLGLDIETPVPAAMPTAAAEQSSQDAMPSMSDFDLDLDLGPKEVATAEATTPPPPKPDTSGDTEGGLDFNFDLDAGEAAVTTPTPTPAPETEPVPDGHSIDFDLDVPVPTAPQPTAPSVDFSSINLDLGEALETPASPEPPKAPELDDAASQDVETKLELAQAYEEMGDKEGARELLQEVLNEGNVVQKETARSKLERLG